MRLLPRSAKGTWLLATAEWLGLCAVVLTFLPVMPRAYIHVPADSELVGLGPNADLALLERHVWLMSDDDEREPTLELFDVFTGRSLATVMERVSNIWLRRQSADGQTWLLTQYGDHSKLLRFDLSTRSLHPLSAPLDQSNVSYEATSRDCRLCVLSDKSTGSLILWDAINDRQRADLPGLGRPVAISDDGKSLVAITTNNDDRRMSVLNLSDLSTRFSTTWEGEQFASPINAFVNADGTYAGLTESFLGLNNLSHCWNVAAGTRCFGSGTTQHGESGRLVGRDTLIVESSLNEPGLCLRWVDLNTGETKRTAPIDKWSPWGVSPTGDTVALWVKAEQSGAIRWLVERVGLRWPFSVADRIGPTFFDAQTGKHLGQIPPQWVASHMYDHPKLIPPPRRWSSDGRFIAIGEDRNPPDQRDWSEYQLWDVPPRKPLGWFALTAGIVALPFAWLARRRVRRLQREAA
jgi:hypothetical protein